MAKKAATPVATRTSGKRDLVRRGTASAYAKRSATGSFKEMDDVGRSQASDRATKARTEVTSGYGDQGDQAPRATKRAQKKR